MRHNRLDGTVKAGLDLLGGDVGDSKGLGRLPEGPSPFQCRVNTLGLLGNRRFRKHMFHRRRMHRESPAKV